MKTSVIVVLLLLLGLSLGCGASTRGMSGGVAAPTPSPVATTAASARTSADFAAHVAALEKRLPSKEFTIVIERPFVVVGDGTAEAVRGHAEWTVRWAVERLKRDFFTTDPHEIIDIWLFKDAASYRQYTRELFGDEPDTPYGYYSRKHKALIMNIETGGGTLVHEIVHPFIEANFPGAPPWLNEGLGSLFEQCADEDGHIRGLTNWRLPGLQRAVQRGALPSFQTLTAMDANEFYRKDKGTNYAQSRYLLYYLQEKNLLVTFYRQFNAGRAADPTGYRTLQKILGERDMAAFQKRWERYVLGLSEEVRLRPVR